MVTAESERTILERVRTSFVCSELMEKKNPAVTYRVAAVLLFGDGASVGVIRKELRRFGRVQERFRVRFAGEEYSPVASGGKRISMRNGGIRPTGRARKENY